MRTTAPSGESSDLLARVAIEQTGPIAAVAVPMTADAVPELDDAMPPSSVAPGRMTGIAETALPRVAAPVFLTGEAPPLRGAIPVDTDA